MGVQTQSCSRRHVDEATRLALRARWLVCTRHHRPTGLPLIIEETTQQALLGEDFSFTNAMLVIATLIVLDVGLSLAKLNSKPLARLLDGHATLVVENGRFLHHRMRRARLTEDDILESARDSQGIENIEQVKFAIVERNGKISIIPAD